MPEENADHNKIEVRKAAEVYLERRRAPRESTKPDSLEKPPDLVVFWRVIRQHRWTVLVIFVTLFVIVLIATLNQKPTYRAKALLAIDNESPSLVSPQELFHLDQVTDTYLETQYKILSSDDLAEHVIDQLGLNRVAEFQPPPRWPWSRIKAVFPRSATSRVSPAPGDAAIREAVLASFQEELDVKPF